MSDEELEELRGAANAYLTYVSGRHRPDLNYSDLPDPMCAAARVCGWVLAEHPADDAERLTADWLRSVGFADDPTDSFNLRLKVVDDPYPAFLSVAKEPGCEGDGGEVALTNYDDPAGVDRETFVVASGRDVLRTRGAVRRLCSALGIELKEPS